MEDPVRDCVGFQLGQAFRRVDRLFHRAYAAAGVSHAHAQILLAVLHRGELRLVEVAALTGFEASSVSRLVQELSRRKLVRRRRDPADKRAWLVSAGARGEALRAELARAQRRANARIRDEIPAADLAGFRAVIDVIARLP